jgi:hypothetical protein
MSSIPLNTYYQQNVGFVTNSLGFVTLFHLLDNYYVDVELEATKEYGSRKHMCFTEIIVDKNSFNENYLAHEMLHAILYKNDFISTVELGQNFTCGTRSENVLNDIIGEVFLNALAHHKFYKLFCALNFNKLEFVGDYQDQHISDDIIKVLKANFSLKNIYYVNLFFYCYSILRTNHNPKFVTDYSNFIVDLKNICPDLCNLLDNLFNDWKNAQLINFSGIITTFIHDLNLIL